ncbi:hypothetical protein PILCRDRAFT_821363 [Piloderma croceum F 1598]|uniref:Uncharacterized protein n=1 Tax=Piloderma croceum (strain F 1598) TaxID=765440 RepID=A0A0C3BW31_PILCF|nr:hypothetical protein PILCRDRAFT_821363 [Piloderma croceum F 1598]
MRTHCTGAVWDQARWKPNDGCVHGFKTEPSRSHQLNIFSSQILRGCIAALKLGPKLLLCDLPYRPTECGSRLLSW